MLQGFYSKDGCWGSKGRSRERVVKCEGCRKRERNGPRETGGKRVIRREGWKRADVTRNDGARNVEKNESGGKARVEGRWWIGAPPCVAPILSLSLWFPPPFSFSRLLSHSLSLYISVSFSLFCSLPTTHSLAPNPIHPRTPWGWKCPAILLIVGGPPSLPPHYARCAGFDHQLRRHLHLHIIYS